MAQINLAPGSQYLIMVRRRRRILYGASALIVLVIIVVGAGLAATVSRREATQNDLQQQLQNVETQIAQASEQVKRIQLFEQRLTTLDHLLQNHRTWTLYAEELERLLPPNTLLTSIEGNLDDGTLDLTGSTPNIDSAAQALASLKNQPVSHTTLFASGTISDVVQEVETGPNEQVLGSRFNFSMKLTLSPAKTAAP